MRNVTPDLWHHLEMEQWSYVEDHLSGDIRIEMINFFLRTTINHILTNHFHDYHDKCE